jgi:hypothetical protein
MFYNSMAQLNNAIYTVHLSEKCNIGSWSILEYPGPFGVAGLIPSSLNYRIVIPPDEFTVYKVT